MTRFICPPLLSRVVIVGAAVFLLAGASPVESGQIGPKLLPNETSISCASGPLQLRYQPLTTPVSDLQQSGDIPLPAFGPIESNERHRYGTFFPPPGYMEGGTFPARTVSHGTRAWLTVAEWNVARGENLDEAIPVMREVDADVWILNETDLYGGPARGRVVARAIAQALGYSYVTSVEFYELRDDRRGMSGNAIVSRYPLIGARSTYIPMYVEGEPKIDLDGNGRIEGDEAMNGGHDWANPRSLAGRIEPRCGQRSAVSAYIEVPNAVGTTTRINLISIHTENFEGFDEFAILGPRIRQLQVQAVHRLLVVAGEPTIMAGDLNTLTVESIGFRALLKKQLAREGGRSDRGSPKAFLDCSFGDLRLTHKVGVLPTDHLDWILAQAGYSNAISCYRNAYRIIDSPASDHMITISRMFVRAVPTPP